MGAALRPIETTECEAAALGAGGFDIEAEGGECAFAFGGEDVGVVAAGVRGARRLQPACGDEAIVEGDGSGHVVVATAGGAEMDGSGGSEAAALATGENAEAFEGAGDSG